MLSTIPEAAVWAIFLAPVVSLVILVVGFPRANSRITGYISIAAVALSCALSFWVLDSVIQSHGARLIFATHNWLSVDGLSITFGVNVDGLSAVMLVVVTSVSLITQIYSQGYMGTTFQIPVWVVLSCQAAMALLCVVFVGLCVNSFIQARRRATAP